VAPFQQETLAESNMGSDTFIRPGACHQLNGYELGTIIAIIPALSGAISPTKRRKRVIGALLFADISHGRHFASVVRPREIV